MKLRTFWSVGGGGRLLGSATGLSVFQDYHVARAVFGSASALSSIGHHGKNWMTELKRNQKLLSPSLVLAPSLSQAGSTSKQKHVWDKIIYVSMFLAN